MTTASSISNNFATMAARKAIKYHQSPSLSERPFVRILNFGSSYAFDKNFTDGNAFVSPEEVVAHLKLLKCFTVLKNSITVGVNDKVRRDKLWQCYLTMAVRRFVIFMNAVMKLAENSTSNEFNDTMNKILPPIDVIMVWHSFLLNTTSFQEHVSRNNIQKFSDYGFPLKAIVDLISNTSFEYSPDDNQWIEFDMFIKDFLNEQEKFVYNSYQPFDPSTVELSVFCQICLVQLATVNLTDDLGATGFADINFKSSVNSECVCGFASWVDHEQLRKRSLWSDVLQFWFPSCPGPSYGKRSITDSTSVVIYSLQASFNNLTQKLFVGYMESLHKTVSNRTFSQLREYMIMNPIDTTIAGNNFKLREDLVACIARQERFVDKMEELNWIYSDYLDANIDEAIERYGNFLVLFKNANFPIVPTLDIDLVWHTHQLNQKLYRKYTTETCHRLLRHDDKIEENRLGKGYEMTCKSYRKLFNKDYSICFCAYCSYQRSKSRNLFQKTPKHPFSVTTPEYSFQHVSCHNSVNVITKRTSIINRKMSRTYSKKFNNQLPWNDNHRFGFMVDPLTPIPEQYSIGTKIFENGMCYASSDAMSACNASGKGTSSYSGNGNRSGGGSSCGGSGSSCGSGCGSSCGGS